jgi:hypothetical protein
MPLDPTLGLATAVLPSIFGAVEGIGQRRQAKRIRANAKDPGYELNSGVMQNRETLANRYGNYEMPGYNQALNNIGSSSATAFNSGVQGASSSGDVLDLATRIAYGTGQQQRQLETQNAQGKEGALFDYLGTNVAAGQERQNANAYDRDQYNRQLDEAAALYNAGGQNINSAITGASSVGTSFLMNPSQKSGQTMGQINGNPSISPNAVKFASPSLNQQPVNTNPLVQYNSLNPILQNPRSMGVTNNGIPSTRPLIPLPRIR